MTNYKEILWLHSLGNNNTRIAESCGCARSTAITTLQRAAEQELPRNKIKNCSVNTPPETVPLDRTNGAARPLKWCMVTADMVH